MSPSLHECTAVCWLASRGGGLWRQNRPEWAPTPTALWGQACRSPQATVPLCKVEGPRARPAGREVWSALAGGTQAPAQRPRRAWHRQQGLTPAAQRSPPPAFYETVLTPANTSPPLAHAGAHRGRGDRWPERGRRRVLAGSLLSPLTLISQARHFFGSQC